MDAQPEQRLMRARQSLEGLSVGDAFGMLHGYRHIPLVKGIWRYTDDTEMALNIFAVLRDCHEIDQDALMQSFARHFDATRGYAFGSHFMVDRVQCGGDWRTLAVGLFDGQGSYGNGSAMRVAPVGAYFADDYKACAEQAAKSAVVTHAHSEAVAGAVAVAIGAAVASNLRGSESPNRADFIDAVLPYVPESIVKQGLIKARDLPNHTDVPKAVAALGNGSDVTCQDTVPFVLWCAGNALYDYEEALWLCASGGGDRDTTCAMVGGIVACYTGIESIPQIWRDRREPLPDWAVGNEA